MQLRICGIISNPKKIRWYPQQPQRFIFTNLSEACCEAKPWKHFSVLQSPPDVLWNLLRNPVEPDLCTKASQTFTGTFSGNLLNLTSLHQSLPDVLRNLLRNPVEPDLSAPPEPSLEPC